MKHPFKWFSNAKNQRRNEGDEAIIFLHIPKCAGTTLTEEILKKKFIPSRTLIFYIHGTEVLMRQLEEMENSEKRQIQCIAGHFAFGIHRYLPQPAQYITILRDPVERVLSHYCYAKREPGHYLYKEVNNGNITLRDYVENFDNIEMDNGQTRILAGIGYGADFGRCGEDLLKKAIENLEKHFVGVGLTERFDDFLHYLHVKLGWEIPVYDKQNVTQNRLKVNEVEEKTLDVIKKYNRLDNELYQYAVTRFEKDYKT
jgi:hypothetical protein